MCIKKLKEQGKLEEIYARDYRNWASKKLKEQCKLEESYTGDYRNRV